MTDLWRWGGMRFPARGLRQTPTAAEQTGWLPRGLRQRSTVALGLAAMAGAAGSAYWGVEAVHYRQAAVAERTAAQTEIAQLRDALGDARQALSAAQERLGETKDEARHKIAASEEAVNSSAERIAQLTRQLDQVQQALRLAEAQRATLLARLSRSEVEAAQDQARQQEGLRAEQEQLEKKLRQLTAEREKISSERDKAETERNRLRNRVGELEQKLSMQSRQQPRSIAGTSPTPAKPMGPAREAEPRIASLPPPQSAPEVPAPIVPPVPAPAVTAAMAPAPGVAATPEPLPAAPVTAAIAPATTAPVAPSAAAVTAPAAITVAPPATVAAAPVAPPSAAYEAAAPQVPRPAAVPAVAHGGIAQFERVLASAGVDVRNLFSQYGMRSGLGGPYIPNPRGSQPEPLSAERLAALGRMVESLPVSAPLHSYRIGSRFGVRGDPINRRAALHTGTDFLAPYMSPVYATAAGVVTFSGYRDDYGKIVEIDHGHGIVTRYGHLHRMTVSVGQRVAARTQIGLLGSTGRTTGPHVHYEVVVNGEPQDPEKFMALGRIVSIVAQR
jgi:murein DD-endopeptidase MepM/ murein hydrolase activator NlpD